MAGSTRPPAELIPIPANVPERKAVPPVAIPTKGAWLPVDLSTAKTVTAAMNSHPAFVIPDDTDEKFAALLTARDRAAKKEAPRR